jgi:hypothetical protein
MFSRPEWGVDGAIAENGKGELRMRVESFICLAVFLARDGRGFFG